MIDPVNPAGVFEHEVRATVAEAVRHAQRRALRRAKARVALRYVKPWPVAAIEDPIKGRKP